MLLQVRERFVGGVSTEVVEGCGDQGPSWEVSVWRAWILLHQRNSPPRNIQTSPPRRTPRTRREDHWCTFNCFNLCVLRVLSGGEFMRTSWWRASEYCAMVTAVVLAAGASSRMGEQKLLLQLGGEPIVRRTVRQVCDTGVDDVLVVVGFEHERCCRRSKACRSATRSTRGIKKVWGRRFAPRSSARRRQRCGALRAGRSAVRDDRALPGAPRHLPSAGAGDRQRPLRRGHRSAAHVQQGVVPRACWPDPRCAVSTERHTDRRIVLEFPADLLQDIDTPDDYEVAKARVSRVASGR